ncbi:MAG: dTDP-4-dehydrorhamnose 3,5-epimerase [Deltaproteobacteria bacterium]|nr:dTDP-4-dehydrorhamnose 3,5-epimerase [Deltaproteobacteria bacterium]
MERLPTKFAEVFRLRPQVFRDSRGYFFEPYNEARLASLGITNHFVMDGESFSRRGTVRGLHFREPGEAKLVRCVRGTIWDVVVDIRPGSATFGQWEGHELSSDNFEQLLVPIGFAHGFSVLSEEAAMLYKKTELYDAKAEKGIRLDDPAIGVDWRVPITTMSDRDRTAPTLKEWATGHRLQL